MDGWMDGWMDVSIGVCGGQSSSCETIRSMFYDLFSSGLSFPLNRSTGFDPMAVAK
jgi:hypothetical protein